MNNKKENKVVVAFIGAFSSGKSSLVNSLLGESLLSTDITPETALPIELYADQQPSFTACWIDGNQEAMSAQQFADAEFSELANQGGWVEAHLPHLKCWPNLVLVDLPGWSSGQSAHERQIDEYLLRLAKTHLDKNIFFVLAISADEGTLRDNVRERLQDLDMGNSPYFLVLTKSEKRAEADIKEICSHLCETVTSCIGKPPEKLIITSARKKQVEELRLAINKIQQTEEDKKSSVDSKVLAKNIDEHIKFLQKNVDYIDDVAIDVSDNVLDDFEWGILESHFDGLPYKWAKSRAESVVFRGEASFREAIKKNIAGKFSNPSQEILKDLKNLEILPPDSNISEKALSTFSSLTTKRLNVAIKKASPYFFESENDDTTGARISSRFRDMRDEFRKDVRYCAYIYLEEWIKSQIAGWERIRNLISN